MSQGALIVGGSVAGIQAALDLADSGIPVHLVESSPFLGNGTNPGIPDQRQDSAAAGLPGSGSASFGRVPPHLLNARLLQVAKHAHITVWTNTRVNRAGGEAGRFQVELRRHPRYVDLAKCTACKDCIEVCPVTVPPGLSGRAGGTSHKAIYLQEGGQPGCAVIDKLGKAPCSNTCPGGIHVQGYVALTAQGRFQEALDLIRQAIPFPGICGRICTHPCEVNCRRSEVDEAVSIRLLKRFLADWELEEIRAGRIEDLAEPIPIRADAKGVAVVGAGPAGMAVADNLVRLGYRVTVFEAQPVVGGMMAMGIPAYRLPREIIRREVELIERLGVEIRLNCPIGPDGELTLDDLFALGYDAIFIGVGAHESHSLRIPGEHLQGVVSGIDLLKAINLSYQTGDPRWQMKVLSYLLGGVATQVAIVGGGNTAMDIARSLRRLGVDGVRILYRRTRAEMPALPEEIDETEHEGIPLDFLVAPVRILGNDQGRVVALECVRMKLGEADPSGRRRPVPIAGSEYIMELDMVVSAIGQSPDVSFLGGEHRFAITREGTFNVDRVSYMTNRPGVFAAGDAITQAVSVIDAIGSAKQAAAGIHAYLQGLPFEEVPVSAREAPISRRPLLPEDLVPKPRHPSPTIPMARRMHSHTEVEVGYDEATAVAEAQRCLMCGPCAECLACEAVCEPKAIVHDEQERYENLEVGTIIWADGNGSPEEPTRRSGLVELRHWHNGNGSDVTAGGLPAGVYNIDPADPLAGSAAAARAMIELFAARLQTGERGLDSPPPGSGPARIGVFVCQCNGQISDIVDTVALRQQAAGWRGVAHAQVLAQSCSEEAADAIYEAVAEQNLNRVVLAACSCCAVDQVCYSCTFQRVRCKDNLLGRHFDRGNPLFEFVNIREQCAWVHDDDPDAATATASAMVAAAVAKTRLSVARPPIALSLARTVLVVGNSPAATICQGALSVQRIQALRVRTLPRTVRQTPGHFTVSQGAHAATVWQGSALVLAPRNEEEAQRIQAAFDTEGRQPRARDEWGQEPQEAGLPVNPHTGTHRPGVFLCDPAVDPMVSGMAAAARAAAWLGHKHPWPAITPASVDPVRCRGCGDCELVCEFGAIQLQADPAREGACVAWIDPAICQGDGTCAARCPAGAIRTGHPTSAQIEAMLEAILE